MLTPANLYGGGILPPPDFASSGAPHSPMRGLPSTRQAIQALTPTLFRAANEASIIYGATDEAILANLLGVVSCVTSMNNRIRGHSGESMPLALQICLGGRPLSGKTKAYVRFMSPFRAAMRGWTRPWDFNNVGPATLLRKIRRGAALALLSASEGERYLLNPMSRAFPELNGLFDGHVPALDRSDDTVEEFANALDSVIYASLVNAQCTSLSAWLDSRRQDAIGSGYLYRLLLLTTETVASEGAGRLQPEAALLEYDQIIDVLTARGRGNLEVMPANQLPTLDVGAEAEQLLSRATTHFQWMASAVLAPDDAYVFAVRLATNARRIAGGMHVFEGYQGAVDTETMARATTIAECFAEHWLQIVFPPKPLPDEVRHGWELLAFLRAWAFKVGMALPSWRKADIVTLAPNFDWTPTQMQGAIRSMCGAGEAHIVTRVEGGRRVVKLELTCGPYAAFSIDQAWQRKLV